MRSATMLRWMNVDPPAMAVPRAWYASRSHRWPSAAERWLRLANQGRGTAIAGGSTFIQRNIVAERILGMPRE
jgi:alkylation response protein AidB-like acyl-CoA dehydrogenase